VVEVFYTAGSPLKGLRIPGNWPALRREEKARALIEMGVAEGEAEAFRLLGQHAAAVKAAQVKFDRKKPSK
jgi:hypothetical protein